MTSNERFPKGALTHHLQNRRWYPSLWSGSCALRGGYGFCGSRWTMRASSYRPRRQQAQCFIAFCLLPACVNLPPAALPQIWVNRSAAPPMFSFAKENQKFKERTLTNNGNLPSGSEGNQPRYRTIRLCRSCLHELFCHSERL